MRSFLRSIVILFAALFVFITLLVIIILTKRPPIPEQLEAIVLKEVTFPYSVDDRALESHFQDVCVDGHHKRGRTLLAADFDLDGHCLFGKAKQLSHIDRIVPQGILQSTPCGFGVVAPAQGCAHAKFSEYPVHISPIPPAFH